MRELTVETTERHRNKVLFLQEFPLTHPSGGAVILSRLADKASDNGFEVVSACERQRASTGTLPLPDTFATTYRRLRFGFGRAIGFVTAVCLDPIAIYSVFQLVRRLRPQAIHVTAHGVCFPVCCLVAMVLRVPLFISVHDLWHLVVQQYVPRRIAHWLFGLMARRANGVFVISKEMGEYLAQRYRVQAAAIVHDAIASGDAPSNDRCLVRKTGNELSLLYVGQLYDMQRDAIESIVDAANVVSQPLRLGFCSNSVFDRHACDIVRIENFGWVAECEINEIARGYQYGLMPMSFETRDRLLYRTSLMTKIVTYLRAGLPIIAIGPSESAAARLVAREGIGVVIPSLDQPAIASKLKDIATSAADDYPRHKLAVERSARTTFNLDVVSQRFYSTIRLGIAAAERTGQTISLGRLGDDEGIATVVPDPKVLEHRPSDSMRTLKVS
jgi:hypothetical protein